MSLPVDAGVHLRTCGGCSTASGFITNTLWLVRLWPQCTTKHLNNLMTHEIKSINVMGLLNGDVQCVNVQSGLELKKKGETRLMNRRQFRWY